MTCQDCGQPECVYEAMRQQGEVLRLRLLASVRPCFDAGTIAYMYKPGEWDVAAATDYIQALRKRGRVVSDAALFFEEMHDAIVAFDAAVSQDLNGPTIEEELQMTTCDYCNEVLNGDSILVNKEAAHYVCAVNAGDIERAELAMEPQEMTWEQQQNWAADIQTAQALMVERDYLGVVKHVGGMYGLSEAEALVRPDGISVQEQAERCMGVIHA